METIRTVRLELVPLSSLLVEAVKRGDIAAAAVEIQAQVSPWLLADAAHVVQLGLAQAVAGDDASGALGRAIVIATPGEPRRLIGTIGFYGPPDERWSLELGCSIDPAYQDAGYGAEAMAALVEWASGRFGVSRFRVSVVVPVNRQARPPLDGRRRIETCQAGRTGSAATRSSRSSAATAGTRGRTSPPCDPKGRDGPRAS